MNRRFLTVLAAWAGLLAHPARAHDPFEITADARIRGDSLEISVTMARSTAMTIAAGGKLSPSFDPEKFEQLRPQFAACAARLFDITAAGKPVAVREVRVELGRELDVEFHLVFPRPAKSPLRFHGALVTKLPQGYGATLTVVAPEAMLGQKLLTAEDPSLEVGLQPPPT